ncbi:uncharacterized protein NPIL_432681 [Nephila pilipes]|uniref:Uncharacterized protein n=1 Tax=Nephila pilipes TaxID=299642 RepID=A0A8X6THB1_NEPPI|nr:uncharacterized protein NPIL_432681 [Nephila pilipes]
MLRLWNPRSHQVQMPHIQSSSAERLCPIVHFEPHEFLQFFQGMSSIKCHFNLHLQHSGSVIINRSTTTRDITEPSKQAEALGTYHSSALRANELPVSRDSGTVAPLRRRGIPRKFSAGSLLRRRTSKRDGL